jgi:nucleotide-binding universal stress UspA family protein
MIKTILVPVDGSAHANKAIALASDLAKKYDARLIALHVMTEAASDRVPPELRDYQRLEHVRVSERSVLESESEQILRDAELQAQQHKGAPQVETVLRSGDAAAIILEVASDRNADLIVMGSRGLGNLKGLLLGSVSHKVGQLSQCSCITVK